MSEGQKYINGARQKNTQFPGHLWSFVIAILIGPILVCHGYYVPESIIVKPKMV